MTTETEEASQGTVDGDSVRALYDVVRGFPCHAVIELFSIGVRFLNLPYYSVRSFCLIYLSRVLFISATLRVSIHVKFIDWSRIWFVYFKIHAVFIERSRCTV